MIITMFSALKNSSHSDLTKIYDSSGNECGFGATKDYPYLFMQTFLKPYKSVCVKKCPKFDYNEIKYKINTSEEEKNKYPGSIDFYKFNKKFAGLSAVTSIIIKPEEAFGYDKDWVNSYFT